MPKRQTPITLDELRACADRFWSNVRKGSPDECWEWQLSRVRGKYGHFSSYKRHIYAHRVAWLLTHGGDIGDKDVCHSCDNPPCCNPAHLWLGTRSENLKDSVAKGRWPWSGLYGSRIGNSKLTEADVLDIRTSKMRGVDLAKKYNTHQQRISDIRRGRIWKRGPWL